MIDATGQATLPGALVEHSEGQAPVARAIAEVRQIMPAPGWFMRSRHEGAHPGEETVTETALACWAVCVGSDGEQFVTGMISAPGAGELLPCTSIHRVDGYSYRPDTARSTARERRPRCWCRTVVAGATPMRAVSARNGCAAR